MGKCRSLVSKCLPSSHILRDQSSACIVECREERHNGAEICPDWDDNQSFCNYYAPFVCVSKHASCDVGKLQPPPTECEQACLDNPPPLSEEDEGEEYCEATKKCIRPWLEKCEEFGCSDCQDRQKRGENISCPMCVMAV